LNEGERRLSAVEELGEIIVKNIKRRIIAMRFEYEKYDDFLFFAGFCLGIFMTDLGSFELY